MTELTYHFSPLMLYILSYLPTAFKKEDFLSFFLPSFFLKASNFLQAIEITSDKASHLLNEHRKSFILLNSSLSKGKQNIVHGYLQIWNFSSRFELDIYARPCITVYS